jgi:glycerol uptake facilitator-like aquaporin
MLSRNKIAMVMAEFLGTATLTMIALAVSQSNVGYPFFISMGVGLTMAIMVLVLGVVSGAHINPAVTIGIWSIRRISTIKAIVYVAAQLLGGLAAYYLFTYMVDTTWQNTGQFDARILVGEAFGALVFTMGIAAAIYQKYTGLRLAVTIGASLTVGLLVASVASVAAGIFGGGFINPAIALGAQSWVWGTYVLGPVLGAIIGFNLYALLFAPASNLVEADKKASKK